MFLALSLSIFTNPTELRAEPSNDNNESVVSCPNFGVRANFIGCSAEICVKARKFNPQVAYYSFEVLDASGSPVGGNPGTSDNCITINDLNPGETYTVQGEVNFTPYPGPNDPTPVTYICPFGPIEFIVPEDCAPTPPENECSVTDIICGDPIQGEDDQYDIKWTTTGYECDLVLVYMPRLNGESCCVKPIQTSGVIPLASGDTGINLDDAEILERAHCFYFRLEYCCKGDITFDESGEVETEDRNSCECDEPNVTEWMCYYNGDCVQSLIDESTTTVLDFELFPNPASDVISLINHSEVAAYITIIDAQGLPMQQEFKMSSSSEDVSIERFESGLYWVVYRDAKGKFLDIEKLIKK